MQFLKGLTNLAKRIVKFELDEKAQIVTIQAYPATFIGWIASKLLRSQETNIIIDKNLFVLEEWGLFGKNQMYIPVHHITSVGLYEKFRTTLILIATVCFGLSIALIWFLGYDIPALQHARVVLFVIGTVLALTALLLKKRVLISIYRGGVVNQLKFQASKEDLDKLKRALEMIMLLSTGKISKEAKK